MKTSIIYFRNSFATEIKQSAIHFRCCVKSCSVHGKFNANKTRKPSNEQITVVVSRINDCITCHTVMSGRQGASIFGRFRSDRNEVEYQRLGAQIQNVKKSNVYVFGDDDICEDEDVVEFEMDSIRSRKRQKRLDPPKAPGSLFVERKVVEGDTLQSLSLQYGCPVSLFPK